MRKISRRARPHTITLYNYLSTTDGTATYQRTVIARVYLDTAYGKRLSERGAVTTDTAQLIIDLRDIDVTSSRTFMPAADWGQLTAVQKAQYFTFDTKNDFFIDGTATETLPDTTKKDMILKYQCFSVTSADVPASDQDEPVIVEVTAK